MIKAFALRSRWPEPLGAYRVARLSGLQQQFGRRFHESVGTADEAVNHPAKAFQQRLNDWQVDTPDQTGPVWSGIPRQRYPKCEP